MIDFVAGTSGVSIFLVIWSLLSVGVRCAPDSLIKAHRETLVNICHDLRSKKRSNRGRG